MGSFGLLEKKEVFEEVNKRYKGFFWNRRIRNKKKDRIHGDSLRFTRIFKLGRSEQLLGFLY